MIFDPKHELEFLETQPAWLGVEAKIKTLMERKSDLLESFDKLGNEKILKHIENVEADIQLFKNILAFWGLTYKKMVQLSDGVTEQANAANKGHDLLQCIDDLRMMYEGEYETNMDMLDWFVNQNGNIKDIHGSYHKLRDQANKYYKLLNDKIKLILND